MPDHIEQATAAPGEKRVHVRQPPRISKYYDEFGNEKSQYCGQSLGMWMSCWSGYACVLPKGHDGDHTEARHFNHEDIIPEGHEFEAMP